MKSKKKKKKKNPYATLLTACRDPTSPGSLESVARYARAHKLPTGKVRETLERDLGLFCTNPEDKDDRRRHFHGDDMMVTFIFMVTP